jgi:hypothetical protein
MEKTKRLEEGGGGFSLHREHTILEKREGSRRPAIGKAQDWAWPAIYLFYS